MFTEFSNTKSLVTGLSANVARCYQNNDKGILLAILCAFKYQLELISVSDYVTKSARYSNFYVAIRHS
jgi:hypothetical protein